MSYQVWTYFNEYVLNGEKHEISMVHIKTQDIEGRCYFYFIENVDRPYDWESKYNWGLFNYHNGLYALFRQFRKMDKIEAKAWLIETHDIETFVLLLYPSKARENRVSRFFFIEKIESYIEWIDEVEINSEQSEFASEIKRLVS